MLKTGTEQSNEAILALCANTAGKREIVAACLFGPLVSGYGNATSDLNVLLILKGFASRLKSYKKKTGERKVLVLAVDQAAFQRDVSAGWLGEIAAEKLLTPYEPLVNADYLRSQEVVLKKRIVWELLESLVQEFPELWNELSINQEYFMYETQMERAKLFPLAAYRFLNMTRNDVRSKNVEMMMNGFRAALEELKEEQWITLSDGNVRITQKFVNAIRSAKIRVPAFLRSVQRAALLHIFSTLPRMLAPLTVEEELYAKSHPDMWEKDNPALEMEDSDDYVFMPTPLGAVPLSDATNIEEFAKKIIPNSTTVAVEIGGVLNSVYLLTLCKDHEERKIIVKKFRDWTGFKWFPLALWSLGTKRFAVLGKSRLEREYALNQCLTSNGIAVPRILHVSPKQRFIFQEFVEGKTVAETVKSMLSSKSEAKEHVDLIRSVGKQVAKTHQLGVSLGDCKPENIIIKKDGEPCFVDLEQASRDGDQPWDIAEFLYYSGHYVQPLAPTNKIERLAKAFIEGYLEAGGKKETIKKVASPRYTKVFTIFTQPHVILAVSNLCRRVK